MWTGGPYCVWMCVLSVCDRRRETRRGRRRRRESSALDGLINKQGCEVKKTKKKTVKDGITKQVFSLCLHLGRRL